MDVVIAYASIQKPLKYVLLLMYHWKACLCVSIYALCVIATYVYAVT